MQPSAGNVIVESKKRILTLFKDRRLRVPVLVKLLHGEDFFLALSVVLSNVSWLIPCRKDRGLSGSSASANGQQPNLLAGANDSGSVEIAVFAADKYDSLYVCPLGC